MKLEVGMYVRTILGIAKYLGKGTCENPFTREIEQTDIYEFDKLDEELWSGDVPNWVFECDIEDIVLKASHNIIDLIEVGDYVNGYKVSFKDNDYKPYVQCDYPVQEGTTNHYRFYEEAIYSIVTKEQFEDRAYKVV